MLLKANAGIVYSDVVTPTHGFKGTVHRSASSFAVIGQLTIKFNSTLFPYLFIYTIGKKLIFIGCNWTG